jgi:hypothetical protein
VRKLGLFAVAFLLLGGDIASGQIVIPESVRKSKPLADLRACINTLIENGKKAGFEAERTGSETFVLHPTREPLVPLASEARKCIAAALPNVEVRKQPRTNLPHRVWSANVEGFHIFCATPEGDNTKDGVSPLGGNGPKRAWQGIYFSCKIGKEISL